MTKTNSPGIEKTGLNLPEIHIPANGLAPMVNTIEALVDQYRWCFIVRHHVQNYTIDELLLPESIIFCLK
jgi:hypothetical protein